MPVSIEPLQPKDAIAYFRSKGLEPSFAWQDVWQEEHAKAFTVAKMMQPALLEDTRAIVDQALTEGWTLERFRAELTPRLKAAGWWGKQLMGDPLTGEVKLVQLGSDKRIRTIFSTNMRVAYQAGNWQRAWRTREDLPYMEFVHNSYIAPRAEHQAWDGTVLAITDPWWDTHYPPCAWGCKCSTRSHSQDMLTARGLKVTSRPIKFDPKVYTNPRTGEITEIERGIDPGWNYNVGKAPLRAITARPGYPLSGGRPVPVTVREEAAGAFLDSFGATPDKGRIIQDRDGWPLAIDDGLFRNARGDRAVPRPDLVADLPAVATALKSYKHVEWLWSDAALDADFDNQVPRIVAEAAKKGDSPAKYRFLRVAPEIVKAAQAQGHNVDDFAHTLDVSGIRHIRNRHSNTLAEAAHGQIAVTPADYFGLPDVLRAPDLLMFGLKNQLGRDLITFFKKTPGSNKMPGAVVVYMAEIRTGRWELAASSLWKSPGTADVEAVADSLVQHVQNNDAGARLKVIPMAGKINTSPYLIRRYTARVDNKTVTVDFSPRTWTYDIQ